MNLPRRWAGRLFRFVWQAVMRARSIHSRGKFAPEEEKEEEERISLWRSRIIVDTSISLRRDRITPITMVG